MKVKIIILLLMLHFVKAALIAQTLPPVPKRLTMFGINIVLEESTRKTIEKEMAFLASKRIYVDAKLAKMNLYFPIIETIFEQENVPKEFKYLCAQESSFIADAVSTSNAVGFWQFKASTATDYGLRVDDIVDERKNIVASTRAAAFYLKNNNKTYRNWVSTLLSYRLGFTGAKNQVPTNWIGASEITIDNNIDWYVIRNIAHFIFFENELEHFEPNGSYFNIVNNVSGKSFIELAQQLQVTEANLKKENTWCKCDIIPSDKNYTILTLIRKSENITGNNEQILAKENILNKPFFDIEVGYPSLKKDEKKSKKENAIFYDINGKEGILSQKGDTPQILADRAKIKLQYLMSYNDLDNADAIKPLMVYYLERKNRKAEMAFHTVKKGQSLWLISQMYGVKEKRILRMNRMKADDALQTGRVLFLAKRRKRKQEIQFERLPFEREQLPTEQPKVIIENTSHTTSIITPVPEQKAVETDNRKAQQEAETPPFENTNNASPLKIVVRDNSEKTIVENNVPLYTNDNTNTVTVQPGETLYSISKKTGVSVDDLKKANNLEGNTIETGKKIVVAVNKGVVKSDFKVIASTKSLETKATSTTKIHVVKASETLYRISTIYSISVEKLKQMNNLPNNTISVGQQLYIAK
jgi:membrane-bound lytic murein transglycosylase D